MDTILLGLAAILLAVGIVGFVRDRRRLRNIVFFLFGLGIGLLGFIFYNDDGGGAHGWTAVILAVMVLAPLLGYPILTLFLLANGVMMVKRERRSLGNLLSLILGVVLAGLPVSVVVVEMYATERTGGIIIVGLFGITLYFGFSFLVFLLASWAYRRIPTRVGGHYVIVLGAGLRGRQVPPLLASRLDKATEVANAQTPPAVLIPSGGQGPGERISEAEAMSAYLLEHGIPDSRIVAEDRARNTRENLTYSRLLLPSMDTHAVVVTNSYHVFRAAMLTRQLGMDAQVVGSKTARYYVPSAFLREFAAMMKQYFGLNAAMLASWTTLVVSVLVLM